jgi:hypothetical protein
MMLVACCVVCRSALEEVARSIKAGRRIKTYSHWTETQSERRLAVGNNPIAGGFDCRCLGFISFTELLDLFIFFAAAF